MYEKILTVSLTVLVILTLIGYSCDSNKEEEPTINKESQTEEVIQEEPVQEEQPTLVGWTNVEDSTITDELKEIFETALNGLLGAKYEPVKLLATQVVNGTNYKFLASGTKTTNPITKGTYNITINKSIDGTISLIDIEVIEEKQEEVKQEEKTISQDITNMYFWIVTFDQYGNEVDRYTAKYGSTVYDPSGKAVTVKGNTRFYVTKDYSTDSSEESNPTPPPTPTPDPGDVNYLYIKNYGSADSSISFVTWGDSPYYDNLSFQYSDDKQNWTDIVFDTEIVIPVGKTFYFKAKTTNHHVYYYDIDGNGGGVYITDYNLSSFASTKMEVGGSIMTLLDPTDTLRDLTGRPGCFMTLFQNFSNLVKADNLVFPATTLSYSCYYEMFMSCAYLESINPDLLPVTNLTGADSCYDQMFLFCGTLKNAPKLPATTLSDYCYNGMFSYCNALEGPVVLPATTLASACYQNMFGYCNSLDSIEVGFSSFDSLPANATYEWLKDVAATGTFIWPGETTGVTQDSSHIPNGWNVQNPPACLTKGTLITMADGSQKPIESLKHGDSVKVFNHETGKITHSKIMDLWHYDEPLTGEITLHFTNNIDISIVVEHSFYNKEENTYVILNKETINKYIGKHFYNADKSSWETLIGATYSDEKVETYYLATENHYNCIAEGMLNVEDGVYYVINSTFDYDNKMRINKFKKFIDIIRYGLFTSKDFDYLTEEEFDSHNLGYLKVALGKGIISQSDLDLLREIWIGEKQALEELNH